MNGSMLWVLVEKLENLNLRTSSALTCNLVPGSGRIIKNLLNLIFLSTLCTGGGKEGGDGPGKCSA